MTVNELIEDLREFSEEGHGESEVYVAYLNLNKRVMECKGVFVSVIKPDEPHKPCLLFDGETYEQVHELAESLRAEERKAANQEILAQ